jgi:hypothetical protein
MRQEPSQGEVEDPSVLSIPDAELATRLERGEVLPFPVCPFPLPADEDRQFLLQQKLTGLHKSISWDPCTGKASGFPRGTPAEADRLRQVLAGFAGQGEAWLAAALPRYARCWRPQRISLHPEEEATRRVRQSARNDLMHLDAFPSRPSHGWRILRLYVNLNPTDPRVWVTSETFAVLLERYAKAVGLPTAGEDSWSWQLGQTVLGLFQAGRRRSVYDRFMLRFHHFLKTHEEFQERCRKRFWTFPPGSAWLVFTDAVSHAVLRGRHALDYALFVAPESLALPELAPAALLQRACGVPVFRRAA